MNALSTLSADPTGLAVVIVGSLAAVYFLLSAAARWMDDVIEAEEAEARDGDEQ